MLCRVENNKMQQALSGINTGSWNNQVLWWLVTLENSGNFSCSGEWWSDVTLAEPLVDLLIRRLVSSRTDQVYGAAIKSSYLLNSGCFDMLKQTDTKTQISRSTWNQSLQCLVCFSICSEANSCSEATAVFVIASASWPDDELIGIWVGKLGSLQIGISSPQVVHYWCYTQFRKAW